MVAFLLMPYFWTLKKAFDKVSHERLLFKLEHYFGIKGSVLSWLADFLSGRKQRVRVNGSLSSWSPVTSGVPQGSVLRPVLFIAFINDLPSHIAKHCKLFADDSKLYGTVANTAELEELQHDIDKCYEWSQKWQMEFHPKKCKVLHFGNKNEEHPYTIGGQSITPANNEKDLGITLSDTLGWSVHINNCAMKANRMVGIIKKTFSYMDKDMFLALYKALIRPRLEYSPEVWNPHQVKDISALEKVQRRATKLVPEYRDLSYEERLEKLKLFPLTKRRLRGDMITTYKIINGLLDVDKVVRVSPNISGKMSTRSHNQQLISDVPRTNMRRHFFTNRIILPWNSLSTATISSDSVNTFKARYDKERLGDYK